MQTTRSLIREAVIKTLRSSLARMAEKGDSIGMIRVSRFLLHLADKFSNVYVTLND